MCCFSGKIERVDATNIFARMIEPGQQLLVYEMQLSAKHDVAMILPIPVVPGSGEDAVRFHSFKRYPELFRDLDLPWKLPEPRSKDSRSPRAALLKVHTVGAFVASFIPSLADFARVDPRFRIPPGTLDVMPEYQDWGFAVFQLSATNGPEQVHPMAFQFPTRDPGRLFFPTIHIHDGALPERAHFAHQLYAQGLATRPSWQHHEAKLRESLRSSFLSPVNRLFDLDRGHSKRAIFGDHPNRDVWEPV
jgi:hypothetical protein